MPDLCTTPPDFTLTNYQDNNAVSLSNYNGKVILLSFMSIYCGHCMQWLKHLQLLQDDYATSSDVQIIGVLFKDSQQVTALDVQTMITSAGVTPTFPLLMDNGTAKALYMSGLVGPTIGYPFSYMISKPYVIANKWHRLSTPNGEPICFDSQNQDDTEYFVRARIDDLQMARGPWDTVLALDYSDTMNQTVTIGTVTQPKVSFLREAVSTFLKVWRDYAVCGDRVAIAYFNCHASSSGALVQILQGNSIQNLIASVGSRAASGCTAMGAGLATGLDLLGPGPNKRFLVVFTDGMQNRNPLIYHPLPASLNIGNAAPANYPPPLTWLCSCTAGDNGQSNYGGTLPVVLNGITVPIYTIGIGVPGLWQQMLQDISSVTVPAGQFNADVQVWPHLKEFFIETLIDLFRGNSLQLVAKGQNTLPAREPSQIETFLLNKSVRKLTVLLSWAGTEAPLTFKLRKDGMAIDLRHKATEDLTYRFVTLTFPHYQDIRERTIPSLRLRPEAGGEKMSRPAQETPLLRPLTHEGLIGPEGNWEVIIERTFKDSRPSVPYHLMILADDKALKYDISVPGQVLFAGDPIPVSVIASEHLKPIEKIFAAEVTIHRPTALINDLFAKPEVKKTVVPTGLSRADVYPGPLGERIAKLTQDKKAMASLLKTQRDTLRLEMALQVPAAKKAQNRIGVFRGTYNNTSTSGIYRLDFRIRGVGERCGIFERVESRTVLVVPRPAPKIARKKGLVK